MFITGVGGTGKSFLIEAIKTFLHGGKEAGYWSLSKTAQKSHENCTTRFESADYR